MSQFAAKIRQLRKERHATQQELGELLGITKQGYSLYENGKREPDFDTLIKLADYFGVDTEYLLRDDESVAVPDGRLKFALFGDAEIDDAVLEDVKRLAKLHAELRRRGE